MGGVVALSSRVSTTFGWRRQHRTPLQGGYSLLWSVSQMADASDYAPKNTPDARGVAQAKAKGFTESCARCELRRRMLQTKSTRESTSCKALDRHLNVGAPTERPL